MLGIFIVYFGELNILSVITEKNAYNDLSKTLTFQFFMNFLCTLSLESQHLLYGVFIIVII